MRLRQRRCARSLAQALSRNAMKEKMMKIVVSTNDKGGRSVEIDYGDDPLAEISSDTRHLIDVAFNWVYGPARRYLTE